MPTFFMAPNANLIDPISLLFSRSTEKTASEQLISGGKTLIFKFPASSRKTFILSVLLISIVIVAAKNSTGWLAFK